MNYTRGLSLVGTVYNIMHNAIQCITKHEHEALSTKHEHEHEHEVWSMEHGAQSTKYEQEQDLKF